MPEIWLHICIFYTIMHWTATRISVTLSVWLHLFSTILSCIPCRKTPTQFGWNGDSREQTCTWTPALFLTVHSVLCVWRLCCYSHSSPPPSSWTSQSWACTRMPLVFLVGSCAVRQPRHR